MDLDCQFLALNNGQGEDDSFIVIVLNCHLQLPIVNLGYEVHGEIIAGRELHHVVILGLQLNPVVGWC